MEFSKKIIEEIKAIAIREYPNEACIFIANGDIVQVKNIAANPAEDFAVDWLPFDNLQAFVHSHPNGKPEPTKQDMISQLKTKVPWGVLATDGESATDINWWGKDIKPFIGREFIHGVSDCYTLIKDYYELELDIDIPEFPRDWEWWKNGEDLYIEGFEKAGFIRISEKEARVHDVFLASIKSDTPNHGGVYLKNGLVLHHVQNRLSRKEPATRWKKYTTHWLRHKDLF